MNYHNITHDDMNNGDGLRVCLWCSGCSLHCKECQNPQTWDKNSGVLFDEDARKEIFEQLNKSYISGITYSGGHPLEPYNIKTITKLAKEIKEKFPNKTQWLYTGFIWENVKDLEIIKYLDVLIDGPYIALKRDITLKWRGSSNQRVIDVQQSLKENKIVLWENN